MALCLEQEVHLARRGCWKNSVPVVSNSEFSSGAKICVNACKISKNSNSYNNSEVITKNVNNYTDSRDFNVTNNDNVEQSCHSKRRKCEKTDKIITINRCYDRKCIENSCCDVKKVMENCTDGDFGANPSQLNTKDNVKKYNIMIMNSVSDVVIKYVVELFLLVLMSMSHKRPQPLLKSVKTKSLTDTTTTSSTSHRIILFMTVSCLLLTSNGVLARPNMTVGSTLATNLEPSSPSLSDANAPVAEASLAAPVPTTDSSTSLTNQEFPAIHELAKESGAQGHGDSEHIERFSVFKVDFAYVETPFIIGIWILFASIAKIGMYFLY